MTAEMQMSTLFVNEVLAPYERSQNVAPGSVLFREGEDPRGVYFVHDGQFDLLFGSRLGMERPLLLAESGKILGLSCVVSDRPHDCSATAKTPATVGFIPRDEFKRLLDEKPELWFKVLQVISSDISACWDCMRSMARC